MKAIALTIALIVLTGCATNRSADLGDPRRAQLDSERACRSAYSASTGDYTGAFNACRRYSR